VLVLTGILPGRAHALANALSGLFSAASTTASERASVKARMGLHYGQVLSYESAEGTRRPTGLPLFEADALAGDKEAQRYDAVVVSAALVEGGATAFDEIGRLATEHGAKIRRYVPHGTPRRDP
jgi:hypothetical protein